MYIYDSVFLTAVTTNIIPHPFTKHGDCTVHIPIVHALAEIQSISVRFEGENGTKRDCKSHDFLIIYKDMEVSVTILETSNIQSSALSCMIFYDNGSPEVVRTLI
jgi:hypothetical protein